MTLKCYLGVCGPWFWIHPPSFLDNESKGQVDIADNAGITHVDRLQRVAVIKRIAPTPLLVVFVVRPEDDSITPGHERPVALCLGT